MPVVNASRSPRNANWRGRYPSRARRARQPREVGEARVRREHEDERRRHLRHDNTKLNEVKKKKKKRCIVIFLVHAGDDARFGLLAGRFVGEGALLRFYVLHCVGLPLAAATLMAIHFWRVRKDGGISGPL